MDSKNPIVISFSSGRTSALMAKYMKERYPDRKLYFVFANTSKEKEASLVFANECDKRWNLGLIWVEAVFSPEKGTPNSFRVVDFESAHRNGEVFHAMVKKYGIPNKSFLHCTRELKERPIRKYLKAIGLKNWQLAIGIRADESHRINNKKRKEGFIYPFADDIKMTEPMVRAWWSRQEWDLELKDYEGNCDFCFKKSRRKRLTLLSEGLDVSQWIDWEDNSDYVFDRDGWSIHQLIEMSKQEFHKVIDKQDIRNSSPGMFNLDFEMSCFCKSS